MAGLGWVGCNGCLIVPGLGSYVVLCEIVCNLPLLPDAPCADGCGGCRRCLEACPTGALVADRVVDCRLCLSYHTIENRGRVGRSLWDKLGRRVFGCDSCQAACPQNRGVPPGDTALRGAGTVLGGASLEEILAWGEADWDIATRASATRRASLAMFVRNAVLAAGCSRGGFLRPALEKLRAPHPELREEIDWALARLSEGDPV
jgi:epoxyqueuosine reductase